MNKFYYHNPVLLEKSICALITDTNGIYVDVTFGGSNSQYYGNFTELSFSGCLIG